MTVRHDALSCPIYTNILMSDVVGPHEIAVGTAGCAGREGGLRHQATTSGPT
jgi:hypothetical protein